MNRGRSFSLSFPPFTRWVKRIILACAGMFFLQVVLQAMAPRTAATCRLTLVCPGPDFSLRVYLAGGHLLLPACRLEPSAGQHAHALDVRIAGGAGLGLAAIPGVLSLLRGGGSAGYGGRRLCRPARTEPDDNHDRGVGRRLRAAGRVRDALRRPRDVFFSRSRS